MSRWFIFLTLWSATLLSAEESKSILVTGGAGFVGSHLCDRLIEQGHTVYCLDNSSSGSKRNIAHLIDSPHFIFVQADIIEPLSLSIPFDEVYNLACQASPPKYQADPIHTLRTNVSGALNVLEIARVNGAKIFQASTSEIYGSALSHPQSEDYWGNVNCTGIRSCYDEGKRCAEALFFDYNRIFGTRIKVGRIFNTYGPRMDPADGRVVSNFIVQALKGNPITIYGDGEQTRSFCYVDDLVDAILLFMDTPDEVTGPLNLGNPDEYTIKQLAEKVVNLTHSTSEVTFVSLPKDDPPKRCPDISRAKEVLDWEPKVSVDTGLMHTIDHFKAIMSHN